MSPGGHAGNWRHKPLEDRARISARQDNQSNRHWPRRWWLFGARVVPLVAYRLLEMKMAQTLQQDRDGFLRTIHRLEAGVRRRNESMGKAHRYIQDLKRHAGVPLEGLTVLGEDSILERLTRAAKLVTLTEPARLPGDGWEPDDWPAMWDLIEILAALNKQAITADTALKGKST